MDVLITDSGADPVVVAAIRQAGVEVEIASAPAPAGAGEARLAPTGPE
jgi:hypothetical protein